MDINLVCTLFVLENEQNSNIRKNNILNLKVLVNKKNKELIRISLNEKYGIKEALREKIFEIIGIKDFHLEQVYALGEKHFFEDNTIDIIYLGVINKDNIKKLNNDYELIDFGIIDNKKIMFGTESYIYKTIEKKQESGIEYFHKINVDDINLEKELLELIISYKHIRSRLDTTDIMFKFMPKYFALEDVRLLYEMIKNVQVDKSNFRKKILKYCVKSDKLIDDKGYRPTSLFEYKPLDDDNWI